jgi:hypothetical protein
MAVWRCPHCATPQPESSRCWVCRRSTTTCVTCRHFRRGVAGGLGWCGRDRRHPALTGLEVLACWTAVPSPQEPVRPGPAGTGAGRPDGTGPGRTFVPVESLEPARTVPAAAAGTSVVEADLQPRPGQRPEHGRAIPGTWWLWGDPDPWPET